MSTADIAKKVGVTRQYAREVLLKNNLETNVPKPQRVVYCKVCRDITTDRGGIHNGECRFKYHRPQVNAGAGDARSTPGQHPSGVF